jgi:hypothetical protein
MLWPSLRLRERRSVDAEISRSRNLEILSQRLLDLLTLLLTLLDWLLLRLSLRLELLSLVFSLTAFSLPATLSSCLLQWLPSS